VPTVSPEEKLALEKATHERVRPVLVDIAQGRKSLGSLDTHDQLALASFLITVLNQREGEIAHQEAVLRGLATEGLRQ
jgi:hypothetical protein